jgi:transposase-like protein
MNFFVNFDNTGEQLSMVSIDPSESIGTIRHNIAATRGVPESDIILYLNSQQLSDDMKLSELKLEDGRLEIHCQVKTEINETLEQPYLDLPKEEAPNLSIANIPTLPTLDDTAPTVQVDDVLADNKPMPWTEQENEELRKKVVECGTKWKKIATFFPNRTYAEIVHHYKKELNPSKEPKQAPWTEEEEQRLVEKVNELGRKWSQIATFFDRTPRAIEGHWEKIMYTGKNMSTKPWTEEEETRLVEKVAEFGTKWTHIAQFFERTPKALERHWSKKMQKENKQVPHESPQPWSEEEELKLKEKVNELGTNWQAISQYFNRTPGGIKLQWYRMKRRDGVIPEEE